MEYLYKKQIGNKNYYYLRASIKKGKKMLTKDIAYLGNDPKKITEKLDNLPSKYSKEIRKTYKTIKRFIEVNHYLEKIKESKIKLSKYIDKGLLKQIEAVSLHWNVCFKKLDGSTQREILDHFIVEFAFNTTSLEGNTITLKQAHNLLVENLTPKNKTL